MDNMEGDAASVSWLLRDKLFQRSDGCSPVDLENQKVKHFFRTFFDVLHSDGQRNLVEDVEKCLDDNALGQLARRIRTGLVIPMRAHGGRTPVESTPSPRSALEITDSTENPTSLNIGPDFGGLQSTLRRHCLGRDGYRCLVTGIYSGSHPSPVDALQGDLEAAHIFPFALGSLQEEDLQQGDRQSSHRRSSIWDIMNRYFPHGVPDIPFNSEHINTEKNILTLIPPLHVEMGRFNIICEATNTVNQYRIKIFQRIAPYAVNFLPSDGLVTFRMQQGDWDLPSPQLLKVHAAIGNFLHISGEADAIEKRLQNFKDFGGLAPGGSTDVEHLLEVSSLSLLLSNQMDDASSSAVDNRTP